MILDLYTYTTAKTKTSRHLLDESATFADKFDKRSIGNYSSIGPMLIIMYQKPQPLLAKFKQSYIEASIQSTMQLLKKYDFLSTCLSSAAFACASSSSNFKMISHAINHVKPHIFYEEDWRYVSILFEYIYPTEANKPLYLSVGPDTECSIIYHKICNKSDKLFQICKLRTEASNTISATCLENHPKYHGSTLQLLLRLTCSKHTSYQATVFAMYTGIFLILIIHHVAFSLLDVEEDFMKQRDYMAVKWLPLKESAVTSHKRY